VAHNNILRYKACRSIFEGESMALKINDKAPAITIPNEEGQPVSLKDFAGKNVVLFFFPKADTPG
jgi:peroxiredoxin